MSGKVDKASLAAATEQGKSSQYGSRCDVIGPFSRSDSEWGQKFDPSPFHHVLLRRGPRTVKSVEKRSQTRHSPPSSAIMPQTIASKRIYLVLTSIGVLHRVVTTVRMHMLVRNAIRWSSPGSFGTILDNLGLILAPYPRITSRISLHVGWFGIGRVGAVQNLHVDYYLMMIDNKINFSVAFVIFIGRER